MSRPCAYTLALTFQGPLLSQASGTLALGFDSAMLRDGKGRPVLRGSLIRGNLRETLLHVFADELVRMNSPKAERLTQQIVAWFGQASTNDDEQADGFAPHGGTVQFGFFWELQGNYARGEDQHRTRIQIGESGKVQQGALQVIEDCFPVGTEPVFSGQIQAVFVDDKERKLFERLVRMALDYMLAMGSFKGIGFGRLLNAQSRLIPTSGQPCPIPKPVAHDGLFNDGLTGQEQRISLEFTLDRPFCISKPRTPDSNCIRSEAMIPGTVLKGLLAPVLLKSGQDLGALAFDQWRVSHAVPMADHQAGRKHPVVPLSIAKGLGGGEADFVDLHPVTLEQFAVLHDEKAPAFQLDWKDKDWMAINGKLALGDVPKRTLLVRTAINSSTQTAAESQLFSMECVEPEGFVWRGVIDLGAVPADRHASAMSALRAVLQQGLRGLGKTKAVLEGIRLSEQPPEPQRALRRDRLSGETITLTLMTPARLFPLGWERGNPNRSAWCLYRAYWQGVAEGSVELVNFFAQQEMHGGVYHYHRFQKQQGQCDYCPEWLTKAGSVFVLRILNPSVANGLLNNWLRYGLPTPERGGITWQQSPYLPEHGYGEVVLDWQHGNIPVYPHKEGCV